MAACFPVPEYDYYARWAAQGYAGRMRYLTDRRGGLRADARILLPSARSMVCVGKLYNSPRPYSTRFTEVEAAWISRYAWGEDYHAVLRDGLERLAGLLAESLDEPFEYRVCVDTAPLLERAYARHAGLGWIGKNTCLIHQGAGSWFFLGELLLSLEIAPDTPPPDRCGSCTRCIDACPTQALVPAGEGAGPEYALDSRLCISYLTIELRGEVPPELRGAVGRHVFGCDICQDVCPWNRRAPVTSDPAFQPREFPPSLERMASISEAEFRALYRTTPIERARYSGFLRNVAVAMGNLGSPRFEEPLRRLACCGDPVVEEHARWALDRCGGRNIQSERYSQPDPAEPQ